ncbi:MAG: diacylglycerol kinase family lipid kinase [Deltaproteobacteria bacterium]|nr:diacylglycerol kinase family lipid kinase [Deltaproteobacteria bacterium]
MGNTFRTLVVLNPKAGAAFGPRRRTALEAAIRRAVRDVEFVETAGPGDATRRVREALRAGAEQVVSVGGDGTHHEVVNGFFEEDGRPVREGAVLAPLPGGTGGDFRKTLGYGRNPLELVALLGDRATRPCDVGHLSYIDHEGRPAARWFLNIASFGLGGLVDDLVNRSSKKLGGFISFAAATVRAMARFRPQIVRLQLNDRAEVVRTISVVACANGRWFGGGMQIAPDAALDDGLFDVVTLPGQTLADYLLRGHRVYAGTHVTMPGVTVERARRVVAEPFDPDEPVLLDVDGEAPGRLPATFELRTGLLRLKA